MDELIAAFDGAAPSRAAKAHVPVSTETIRFVRGAVTPRGQAATPVTPAPAEPTALEPVVQQPVDVGATSLAPNFVGVFLAG